MPTTQRPPDVVELPETPDLTSLLARAATAALPLRSTRSDRTDDPGGLPSTTVRVAAVAVHLDAVADYTNVCGFALSSDVPVTFPHLLGFPLSVWLMTRDDFPYDLLGVVHVANRITAHAPIPVGADVDVTARVANARPHRRGVQFDNLVEVHLDGALAWESASTYLRRGPVPDVRVPGGPAGDADATDDDVSRAAASSTAEDVDPAALPLTGRWRVPADIGRRYGAVSGDRNPIHLSAVSARAFGFDRAIAHGMWTKAHAVAGLGPLDLPCTVDVVFRTPVGLPSTITYATRRDGDGWSFGLRGRDGRPHLAGTVTRD